ncbi:MAG: carbon-nitrogen hydrolase family protein [Kiritimatiellia bacterium]|jgi:nitrilase
MARSPLRVVAVQTASGPGVAANLTAIEALLPSPGSADLVVLPESFACRGARRSLRRAAEPVGGPITQWLAATAVRLGSWVLGGSIPERDGTRIFNTSLLLDPRGRLRAAYRKIHLFRVRLEDGTVVSEHASFAPGNAPCLARIGGWCSGLSICFDLRFSELYRGYAAQGAELLLIPSDFTDETGRAHWEVLLRARAIENQCWVVAPNQCGVNAGTGVRSHGHSLIVDPWGRIVAQAGTEPGCLAATCDPELTAAIRRRMPM